MFLTLIIFVILFDEESTLNVIVLPGLQRNAFDGTFCINDQEKVDILNGYFWVDDDCDNTIFPSRVPSDTFNDR